MLVGDAVRFDCSCTVTASTSIEQVPFPAPVEGVLTKRDGDSTVQRLSRADRGDADRSRTARTPIDVRAAGPEYPSALAFLNKGDRGEIRECP